jgi:uncharacterized lipoprotein YajG
MRIRIPALVFTAALLVLTGCESHPSALQPAPAALDQGSTPPSANAASPPADSTRAEDTRNGAGMFGSGT